MIINKIIWAIASITLIISSIYFTKKYKFKQLNIKKLINIKKEKSIILLSLASKIGVGSISGIALAIYIAGPGTLFWIQIFTILIAINTYVETKIALKYKKYTGGPAYYIKYGLKNKNLSKIVKTIIFISFLIGFIPIQANTIINSININKNILTLLICVFTTLIILKGIKTITKITDKLVPLMILLYLIISIIITIKNINIMPNIIKSIITQALNIKAFTTSFIPCIITGLQRAIFASEAGIGIGTIISSNTNSKDHEKTCYAQILCIYITIFLICNATAIILLTSNYQNINLININGIELIKNAFQYHFKTLGQILLFIIIFLFSFSTIISGYINLEKSTKIKKIILKPLTIIFIYLGCIINATTIWTTIDTLIGLLAIINTYTIIKLEKK